MIVYSDDREVFRALAGNLDTYLDCEPATIILFINAWDSAGNLTSKDGIVTLPTGLRAATNTNRRSP